MKKIWLFMGCFFALTSIIVNASPYYPYEKLDIKLTLEQKEVIKEYQNKEIKVVSFVNSKEDFILKDIAQTFGFKFKYIKYDHFQEALDSVIKGDNKLITNISYNENVKNKLDFSSYADVNSIHFFAKKYDILNYAIYPKISVNYKDSNWANVIQKDFPKVTVVPFESFDSLLNLFGEDKIDAVLVGDEYYERLMVAGLYPVKLDNDVNITFTSLAGTKDETKPLLEIISKYLATQEYQIKIRNFNKEFYGKIDKRALDTRVKLLKLDTKKVYKVAISGMPPLAEYIEGNYRGIFYDLFDEISQKIGIKYEIVSTPDDSWDSLYKRFLNGEIDIILPITKTPARSTSLNFSVPMYASESVVVRRANYQNNNNVSLMNLVFERLGVVKGKYYEEQLNKIFTRKNIYKYDSVTDMIKALKSKEVDYIILDKAVFLQYVKRTSDLSIYIDDNIEAFKKRDIAIGTHKNAEGDALSSLISNAYRLIDTDAIIEKYTNLMDYKVHYQKQNRIILVGVIILILFLIILASLTNNLHILLKKEKQNATYDYLTSLPNRRLFAELLDYEIKKSTKSKDNFALLFLDLDGFKTVNDTLGHEAGDKFLKEVAIRLRNSIRSYDIVSRPGGDEFTLIITDITRDNLRNLVDGLLADLNVPFELCNKMLPINASIGIAMFPEDGSNAKALLANADAAMYNAKEMGKNRYHFYNVIDSKRRRRKEVT